MSVIPSQRKEKNENSQNKYNIFSFQYYQCVSVRGGLLFDYDSHTRSNDMFFLLKLRRIKYL